MNTAIVVNTPKIATELNKLLPEGSRAFALGQAKVGHRFNQILVLTPITGDKPVDWFGHFKCCLTPGGRIFYD